MILEILIISQAQDPRSYIIRIPSTILILFQIRHDIVESLFRWVKRIILFNSLNLF